MMGIMADTHDNLDAIRDAVQLFNREKVELVIHAGDLIAPFTAREFQKLNAKFVAVFGNNDGEREGLRTAYRDLCILKDFREVSVSSRKFAVIHGMEEAIVNSLAKSGLYDVVVRGHSHKPEIINGETLVVNPGEVCGYVSGDRTVVIMDPDTLSHELIYL
ncbi:metallophosphoesterase [Methanobacterium aggregans]|uniref:metallophosphoesterase n=1 Tax=Methanobacterium aggregans TaxID=1615586 RepID=UPI001AEA8B45|nr:metallophosphoesterase [Methanobacterium aggregans]MBP2046422.1 putative phosphoesterase [Methanobacterium aggregans]